MKLSFLLLLTNLSLFAHPNWNCQVEPTSIQDLLVQGDLSVGTNPNGGLYLRGGSEIILESTQVMKSNDLELQEWNKVKNLPSDVGTQSLYQAKLMFKQVRFGSVEYRRSGVPSAQEINFWSEDIEALIDVVCTWDF
ncbi:hypothetical protein N9N67_07690 [Bacteriovoracaceae bacterium]|nr:hypothetical protein [Bacteriovoracaceae bacterium]